MDTKALELSSPTGRENAAKAALEEAALLWQHGFVKGVDVALVETARVLHNRAFLLATFVHDPPFATYVRELLRRLKRLGRDVSRFARRTKALASARVLLHRAQRALEHFDFAHPQPGTWSRAEWSKRRTRRLAAVGVRAKALATARDAISPEAEATYKAQAHESAQSLEEWSLVVLKRYPIESGRVSTASTPPPEVDPWLDAAPSFTVAAVPRAVRHNAQP